MPSNYYNISLQKEHDDIQYLISLIKKDGWITPSTVMVNCFPEYSSRLTQSLNHGLSSINRNDLFEQIILRMPYPNCHQVWNDRTKTYDNYDSYLKWWVAENVFSSNFLFIMAATLDGKVSNKLKLSLRHRLENENFRFASLYVQDDTILTPDYYTQLFNKQKDGGILFHWENEKNPNWDY